MSILADTLEELAVMVRDKHQAGRHDQKTHDPHKGKVKAGRGVTGSELRRVEAALSKVARDMPASHLDGFDIVVVKKGERAYAGKATGHGLSKKVSVPVRGRDGKLLSKRELEVLLAHEVGHQVWHRRLSQPERDNWVKASKQIKLSAGDRDVRQIFPYLEDAARHSPGESKSTYDKRYGSEVFAELYGSYHDGRKSFVRRTFIPRYRRLEELHTRDAESATLKHQAGRHDQSRHTPEAYLGRAAVASVSGGTPVTMEWLSQPLQEEMFEQYYEPEQKRLKQALIDGNVTQEDLEGFQGFSDRPLSGKYKYDHEGTLRKNGLPIAGVYFHDHAMVHISKGRLYGDSADLSKTVTHEIGHHKIDQMRLMGGNRKYKARQVIRRANLRSYTNDQLGNAGLRIYSTTSGGELLADTFVVMRKGTPEQKALLTNIWSEADFDSLGQIYKALEMVFANELRAIYNDDGTIDTVLTPTIVSRDIYEKTPWYYVDAS